MMKGSKIGLTLAEKCKTILSSNWQGHLNTIKADAKGCKDEIHSSKVKYISKKGKPYIWVPEKDMHNLNTIIDERGSFSVTSHFPTPLGSLLKLVKKLPARVALTGDVVPLSDKKVQLSREIVREAMLAEHKAISESSYAVYGILSSSNLRTNTRSGNLLELLDGEEPYTVYKFELRSCRFIDNNGRAHNVEMKDIEASKPDHLAPFIASLIDGINQSETRRRALSLICFTYCNANTRDAYILSVDRKGIDVMGMVPGPVIQDGTRQCQWKEFRIPLKEEARDLETFCQQLAQMEEESLKKVSVDSGLR